MLPVLEVIEFFNFPSESCKDLSSISTFSRRRLLRPSSVTRFVATYALAPCGAPLPPLPALTATPALAQTVGGLALAGKLAAAPVL